MQGEQGESQGWPHARRASPGVGGTVFFASAPYRRLRFVRERQEPCGVLQCAASPLRKHNILRKPEPLEESNAQLPLQSFDARRHRGLAVPKLNRRASKVTRGGEYPERLELL
jgi:hypothetical protein